MDKLKAVGLALTIVGGIVQIASNIVGDKSTKLEIAKQVQEAISNQK